MEGMTLVEKRMFLDTQTAFRQQLNVLTVEVALILERTAKAFGSPLINTESEYYKSVHGPSLEILGIRRSLELLVENAESAEGQNSTTTDTAEGESAQARVTIKNEAQLVESSTNTIENAVKVEEQHNTGSDVNGTSSRRTNTTTNRPMDGQPVTNTSPNSNVGIELIDISDDEPPTNISPVSMRTQSAKKVKHSTLIGTSHKAVVKIRKADTDAVEDYLRSKNSKSERRTRIEVSSNPSPKKAAAKSKPKGQTPGLNIVRIPAAASGCKSKTAYCGSRNQKLRRKVGGERRFKCQYCEIRFTGKGHLDIHERIHTGVKPFKCRFCPAKFSSLDSKVKHERIHSGERPFRCHYCVVKFTNSGDRTRHERIHTGAKPYKCRYCKTNFRHLNTKTIHERIHTGEKPYKCSHCDKTFTQRGSQITHQRIHTGEKPYKCRYCKACFCHLVAKKCHERLHTGEKPYHCKFCDKVFRSTGNRSSHVRTHTKEKPFQCPICNQCFARAWVLKSHVSRRH